jgi:hypothetical protein
MPRLNTAENATLVPIILILSLLLTFTPGERDRMQTSITPERTPTDAPRKAPKPTKLEVLFSFFFYFRHHFLFAATLIMYCLLVSHTRPHSANEIFMTEGR